MSCCATPTATPSASSVRDPYILRTAALLVGNSIGRRCASAGAVRDLGSDRRGREVDLPRDCSELSLVREQNIVSGGRGIHSHVITALRR